MNIGILRAVVVVQCVDDGLRLLARRAVVQVHQRLAVDLLLAESENPRARADIEMPGQSLGHLCGAAFMSLAQMLAKFPQTDIRPAAAAWSSILIRATTSLAKAKLKKLRASAKPMPRDRK